MSENEQYSTARLLELYNMFLEGDGGLPPEEILQLADCDRQKEEIAELISVTNQLEAICSLIRDDEKDDEQDDAEEPCINVVRAGV